MSLPVTLSPGYASIYGAPSTQGLSVPYQSPYQFGTIDQLPSTEPEAYGIGQSVMYNINDTVQVIYSGITYYLIPQNKILLTENPPM